MDEEESEEVKEGEEVERGNKQDPVSILDQFKNYLDQKQYQAAINFILNNKEHIKTLVTNKIQKELNKILTIFQKRGNEPVESKSYKIKNVFRSIVCAIDSLLHFNFCAENKLKKYYQSFMKKLEKQKED
jgi:hypothetical protein